MWKVSDLINVTKAQVLEVYDKNLQFDLVFDSRKKNTGSVFLALKGDQFDAHDFLPQAFTNGAIGFIIHQKLTKEVQDQISELSKQLNRPAPFYLQVQDTLRALHQLANFYRKSLKAKVLGVAGSNGKTTTKEFLATICQEAGKTHYSSGSFNNHWGVPFTILSCPEDADYLILEMGMNHSGELKQLTEIAQPNVSVLTMVGVEHIEHFGTLEKIAEAEEEIFKYSPTHSILVINKDNFFTNEMSARYQNKKFYFSDKEFTADVFFKKIDSSKFHLDFEATIQGQKEKFSLNLFGEHNLTNLMAAATTALAANVSYEKLSSGLKKCKGYWGRNQWIKSEKGFDILFDGYNSSPESLSALIENVKKIKVKGNLFAVIGQMKELGDLSAKYHVEAGKKVSEINFKSVWFVGEDFSAFEKGFLEGSESKNNLILSDSYKDSLALQMVTMLEPDDLVIIKGSRGVALERFVKQCWPIDFSDKK